MNTTERDVVKQLVYEMLKQHPEEFCSVIDLATAGVKAYAEKQGDTSGALSARLITVLENNKVSDFGLFSAKEVLEALESSYGGIPALAALKKKYRVKGPSSAEIQRDINSLTMHIPNV